MRGLSAHTRATFRLRRSRAGHPPLCESCRAPLELPPGHAHTSFALRPYTVAFPRTCTHLPPSNTATTSPWWRSGPTCVAFLPPSPRAGAPVLSAAGPTSRAKEAMLRWRVEGPSSGASCAEQRWGRGDRTKRWMGLVCPAKAWLHGRPSRGWVPLVLARMSSRPTQADFVLQLPPPTPFHPNPHTRPSAPAR